MKTKHHSRPWRKGIPRKKTLAEIIDEIAEQHGINRTDVIRFPKLLKAAGVFPLDVETSDLHKAESIHRSAIRAIIEKHGANRPKELAYETKLEEKPQGRQKIFDHPATSIVKWMGSEEWSFDKAKATLLALGVDLSDGTIRVQLSAGKRDGAEVPSLKMSQAKKLASLASE
jgi:hypothetical protein